MTRYVRVRPARLPWIELLFMVHYTEFGLAVMATPLPLGMAAVLPRSDCFDQASILALFSGLAMLFAFWLVRRATPKWSGARVFPRLDAHILERGGRVHFVLAAVFVLFTSYTSALRGRALANVGTVLFSQSPLAIVAALAFLVRPARGTALRLGGAFLILVAAMAATSMLNDALVPLVVLAAIWWRARGRIPVMATVVAVAAMLFLQPIKQYYRAYHYWDHPDSGVVEGWQYAFSQAASESRSPFSRGPGREQQTLARLSELSSVAYVVQVVPRSVPYTGGAVYEKVLAAAIPRVFWPDKPDMTKYALNPFVIALDLDDDRGVESSTTGLTLTAQGYLEHGVAGSIGWMALLGAVLALLSRYCGTGLAGTLAGASLLGPLMVDAGGGFYNVFGGLWQYVAGATLLTWLVWLFGGGHSVGPGRAPALTRAAPIPPAREGIRDAS